LAADLVIFDFDGVIADTEPLYFRAFVSAAAEVGIRIPEAAAKAVRGRPLDSCVEILQDFARSELPCHYTQVWRGHLAELFEQGVPVVPGVAETLAALDVPIAVASNGNRERVVSMLASTGLDRFIGAVFCPEDGFEPKPEPDLLVAAACWARVPAWKCLAIDDSPTGLVAALRAGMSAVGFAAELSTRSDLVDAGATAVLCDLRDVLQLVRPGMCATADQAGSVRSAI
jgi:HAD superfamily hydrolase (TIGR01509 family)